MEESPSRTCRSLRQSLRKCTGFLKIRFECASCLVNRASVEASKASTDPAIRLKALLEALSAIGSNVSSNVSPAYLGTIRDRTIKRVSGNPDPFRDDKIASNERALKLIPQAKDYVFEASDESAKFRRACLVSIVGNAFEFGIKGYDFKYEDLPHWIEKAENDVAIDHIDRIESIARTAKRVLLLTDNAGEIALDKLLVELLRQMGSFVTVAVKASPISNDATMDDAVTVGMTELADEVITTGTDTVGLLSEECNNQFLAKYVESELVIAKGMAHYETLFERKLTQPHALLFRVKCVSIAEDLGVKLGKNVAYLVEPTNPRNPKP
jgi:uncharacterized protein with ATP-grasp and redox domains